MRNKIKRIATAAVILSFIGLTTFIALRHQSSAEIIIQPDPIDYEQKAMETWVDDLINSPEFQQNIREEAERQWHEYQKGKAEEALKSLQTAGFFQADLYLRFTEEGKVYSRYQDIVYNMADEYLKEDDGTYPVERGYTIDGDLMTKIIECESSFNPKAKSNLSSASGLAQFIDGTWATTPQGKAGRSRFEPEANIAALAWLLDKDGISHWEASRHCWGS